MAKTPTLSQQPDGSYQVQTSHNKPHKTYTCMSFNFSRLSTDKSAIQRKTGFEWLNFSSTTVNTSATQQIPSFLHLPVVLVRFKIRSSSSLTNGELVARGLVTAVFT